MTQLNDVTSETDLAEHFLLSNNTVREALAAAGLQPIHTLKQGKGVIRIYKTADAVKVIQAHLDKPKGRQANRTRPEGDEFTASLKELNEAMAELKSSFSRQRDMSAEALDGIEQTNEAVAKIQEQNALLWKSVEAMTATLTDRLTTIQQSITTTTAALDQLTQIALTTWSKDVKVSAVEPASPPPEVPLCQEPASAPRKVRVGIVGLLNSQRTVIEKEFGSVFDLRFFTSETARGKGFASSLTNCQVVFAMINFINHGIEATVRASDARLVRVNGGVTSLRDKLTELFVNQPAATTA